MRFVLLCLFTHLILNHFSFTNSAPGRLWNQAGHVPMKLIDQKPMRNVAMEERDLSWHLCRSAAHQGDPQAQFIVALCYGHGNTIPRSKEIAAKWYQKAAEQGHGDAQYFLGHCYQHGIGVRQNLHLAMQWYQKAAYQGNVGAQTKLSMLAETMSNLSQKVDRNSALVSHVPSYPNPLLTNPPPDSAAIPDSFVSHCVLVPNRIAPVESSNSTLASPTKISFILFIKEIYQKLIINNQSQDFPLDRFQDARVFQDDNDYVFLIDCRYENVQVFAHCQDGKLILHLMRKNETETMTWTEMMIYISFQTETCPLENVDVSNESDLLKITVSRHSFTFWNKLME